MKKISFNLPSSNSLRSLTKLKKSNHFSSGGKYNKLCENWLKHTIKCKETLLVHSCTAALEMSALLIQIKKDDEIIMPSYTFVSTANAFVLRGGKPVFVDVDLNTCNIDPSKIEKMITDKTKAIVVVHYAGVSCDMDYIINIAKKNNIYVIEDNAQGIMSKYKNKHLGSMGDLSTLSFHETKNIHCGQGGALLINNPKFIKRAKVLRDKGTNRDLFNKNIVKKYVWQDIGSSFGISEINACFLYDQLKKSFEITTKRRKLFHLYHNLLKNLETKRLIKRPTIPSYAKHNGHLYYIIIKKKVRKKIIDFLKTKNIYSCFHYLPLHKSPFGRKISKFSLDMKNTNYISRNLLRLPMHVNLRKEDIFKICKSLEKFFKKEKLN